MTDETWRDDEEHPFEEEYESIPWDALTRPSPVDWRRVINLVALAVGVAAVAALTVRTLWPTGGDSPAAVSSPVAAAVATAPASSPATTPVPTTVLPTESDLMALDTDTADRLAAAYAEWYVSELFTVEGSSPRVDAWTGTAVDDGGSAVSFVDSATAIDVVPTAPDRRLVTVVVRSLSSLDPAEGYRREPTRAVQVAVVLTDDGPGVEDYPSPAPVPDLLVEPVPVTATEVDEAVTDIARRRAEMFGRPDSSPISYGVAESGAIRVLLAVTTETGVTVPMAFWFDPDGSPRF